MSPSASRTRSRTRSSTSPPTYPVSLNLVASPLTKGALIFLAISFIMYVLPTPVGPNMRILFLILPTISLLSSGYFSARLILLKCVQIFVARIALAPSCFTIYWSRYEMSSSGFKSKLIFFSFLGGSSTFSAATSWGITSGDTILTLPPNFLDKKSPISFSISFGSGIFSLRSFMILSLFWQYSFFWLISS